MTTRLLIIFCCLCSVCSLRAQQAFTFSDAADSKSTRGRAVILDYVLLRDQLAAAPVEFSTDKSAVSIDLPLPDGTTSSYRVYDADLLPGRKDFGSYRVVSDHGTGRIATSPRGISGVVEGPNGYFVIDGIDAKNGLYRVAAYADYLQIIGDVGLPSCGYDDTLDPSQAVPDTGADAGAREGGKARSPLEKRGAEAWDLRAYDIVMTNTGEFAQSVGGTEADVLEAFNTAVSTVNAILEPQVGIRLNLIDLPGLIYLDPATDPYSRADQGGALLGQVVDAFEDNQVAPGAYDLGHLLTGRCRDVAGVVSGTACNDNSKTRGVTCVRRGDVVGAAIKIMAHEVAHQFDVSHTWNNCPNSANQRASATAFEPGAGNSIMSYANTCGDQDVGSESPYYHVASIEEFYAFTRGGGGADGCATVVPTDNVTPDVTLAYQDGFAIPISTPFRLEGTATDDNGDDLLFNWEQYDLIPTASDIRAPRSSAPLFQSVPPTPGGFVRYFPRLDRVVNDIDQFREVLPDYERELTFRLTAHDYNEASGAVDWETVRFRATESAGPFLVNTPPSAVWTTGSFQEVTWEVAGTDLAPVSCTRVSVLLSTDNGVTFDRTLAENVANSGSISVTIPEGTATANARIMVAAADNVFFNVNPGRFDIVDATEPTYTLRTSTSFEQVCLPDVLSVDLNTSSILGFAEDIRIEVEESSLPAGTGISLANNTLAPSEGTELTVDFADVNFTGVIDLVVYGITNGVDTARRAITLDIVANNYEDLELLTPMEGTNDIVLGAEFDWEDAVSADRYQIQIATSPAFEEEDIYEEEVGLIESDYIPAQFFEPNTLYYWRVRGENRCGFGEWRPTRSFKTVSSDCTTYAYDGNPVVIPAGGATMRSATINVGPDQVINDLNVPTIDVNYLISVLKISLASPSGKKVVLYDRNCRLSSNIFRAGYDDDALERLACGSQQTRVVTPRGTLADFNGDRSGGDWSLEVENVAPGTGNGSIRAWSVEFCTNVAAAPLTLVGNTASRVAPLGRATIDREALEVTSDEDNSLEVRYTITDLPNTGTLSLYGTPLVLGSTFRQADINGRGLTYQDAGSPADDAFGFVVLTASGGYLPIAYHEIVIDELVSTDAPSGPNTVDHSLRVFPNPAVDALHLTWEAIAARELTVALFDAAGRQVRALNLASGANSTVINVADLAPGVYLLRMEGAVRRVVKR